MVSVCIPTYNGEKYLQEQIDSILPQLLPEDEIVISDDSSTDQTLAILQSYQDPRIRILPNNTFRSPIFNLENALKHSRGDYIFTADQDDIWLPGKVEQMLASLQQYDLVVSDCKIINQEKTITAPSFFALYKSSTGFIRNLIKNSYLGCCIAFRKDILNYVLPFPATIAMHDLWIGLCVELHGKTHFLPTPLLLYRRHGNNASFTGDQSQYSLAFKLKYRANMLYLLLKRYWN